MGDPCSPEVTTELSKFESFVAQWSLDTKSVEALCQLDASTLTRVMNDFAPQNPARANQMLMGFLKGVANRVQVDARKTSVCAGQDAGGNFGEAAVATGDRTIDDFVARWGLDSK